MGCLAAFALTSLSDSNASFFNPGLPVFYRTKNFDEATVGEGVSEMGFTVSPVLTGAQFTPGTTDVQICPPPGIRMLTTKQLADATVAGTNLRAGARIFSISHTWVASIQAAMSYANPRQVFNDPSVVGLFHDGLLFELVSFVHNDMYGNIINWDVTVNGNEIK
jgi:hypothetical protein